jgi:hypothetical protein
MSNCSFCKRPLNDPRDRSTDDCGGDCVLCMAEIVEDPSSIRYCREILNLRKELCIGYTHYWEQPSHTPEEFDKISAVVAKIVRLSNVKICGGDGTGRPTFGPLEIMMNGASPELDHETFVISAGSGSDFCKTARKPYDLVVTACLAYLASRHGWSVSSDGDAEDWTHGVDLASEALGEPVPNPLIVTQLKGTKP